MCKLIIVLFLFLSAIENVAPQTSERTIAIKQVSEAIKAVQTIQDIAFVPEEQIRKILVSLRKIDTQLSATDAEGKVDFFAVAGTSKVLSEILNFISMESKSTSPRPSGKAQPHWYHFVIPWDNLLPIIGNSSPAELMTAIYHVAVGLLHIEILTTPKCDISRLEASSSLIDIANGIPKRNNEMALNNYGAVAVAGKVINNIIMESANIDLEFKLRFSRPLVSAIHNYLKTNYNAEILVPDLLNAAMTIMDFILSKKSATVYLHPRIDAVTDLGASAKDVAVGINHYEIYTGVVVNFMNGMLHTIRQLPNIYPRFVPKWKIEVFKVIRKNWEPNLIRAANFQKGVIIILDSILDSDESKKEDLIARIDAAKDLSMNLRKMIAEFGETLAFSSIIVTEDVIDGMLDSICKRPDIYPRNVPNWMIRVYNDLKLIEWDYNGRMLTAKKYLDIVAYNLDYRTKTQERIDPDQIELSKKLILVVSKIFATLKCRQVQPALKNTTEKLDEISTNFPEKDYVGNDVLDAYSFVTQSINIIEQNCS